MRLCFAAGIAFGLATAAHAQNLVPDPAFRFGTGAWTGSSLSGNFTMTFVPGVSARPGSGSALLNVDGPASGTFFVCVAVTGGRTYEWGRPLFFPDASRTIGLDEGWSPTTVRRTGSESRRLRPPDRAGITGGVVGWNEPPLSPAPANCRSILVGFATCSRRPWHKGDRLRRRRFPRAGRHRSADRTAGPDPVPFDARRPRARGRACAGRRSRARSPGVIRFLLLERAT